MRRSSGRVVALGQPLCLDGHQQTLERQTAVLTKLAAAAAG
jgi:hypothetical protein